MTRPQRPAAASRAIVLPPRGKRRLPPGIRCVKRTVSLPPIYDRLLNDWSSGLRGGRSAMVLRLIRDEAGRGRRGRVN